MKNLGVLLLSLKLCTDAPARRVLCIIHLYELSLKIFKKQI